MPVCCELDAVVACGVVCSVGASRGEPLDRHGAERAQQAVGRRVCFFRVQIHLPILIAKSHK